MDNGTDLTLTGNLTVSNINTTGQIVSTKTGNQVDGGGQIYLNGTQNRIDFNRSGLGAPKLDGRSNGTKITLYPEITKFSSEYAIGVEAGAIWHSVPKNTNVYSFKWYAGANLVASLSGGGAFSCAGNVTGANLNTGAAGIVSTNRLFVTGVSALGTVNNVKINGGTDGQVLTTNGTGSLRWTTPASGSNVTLTGVTDYYNLTSLPELFDGQYENLTGAPTFATVATSGDYADLINTPTIPTVPTDISELTDTTGLLSSTGGVTDYNSLTNLPQLFDGNYSSLVDAPAIPTVPTDISELTDHAYLLSKITNGTTTVNISNEGHVVTKVNGVEDVLVVRETGMIVTGSIHTTGYAIIAEKLETGHIIASGQIHANSVDIQTDLNVIGNASISHMNAGGITSLGLTYLGDVNNVTITGGSNGQVLSTNGEGVLSWVTPTSSGADTSSVTDYNSLTNLPQLFDGQYSSLAGLPTVPTDISELTDTTGLLSGTSDTSSTALTFVSVTSNVTQPNNGVAVPNYLKLDSDAGSNGISIVDDIYSSVISTSTPGRYNIQISAQLEKTDGGVGEIEFWLVKNGEAVANSAKRISIHGKSLASWDWIANSTKGTTRYEIMWASTDLNVQLTAMDASNTLSAVAVPSVTLNVMPVGA